MKYQFEQFNTVIENPSVEIDYNSIRLNSETMKATVDVVLVVENARMAVTLNEIPFVYPFVKESLVTKVTQRLTDFEIN